MEASHWIRRECHDFDLGSCEVGNAFESFEIWGRQLDIHVRSSKIFEPEIQIWESCLPKKIIIQ
jgi:hypothetical protein